MERHKVSLFIIIALGMLVAPGLISPPFLDAQVNLSSTSDMSELPFIIIRPDGEIIVAWTEGHFNGWGHIHYRTFTESSGWSPTRVAVTNERGSAAFPQMALDSRGDVHMAYMDGAGSYWREIFYIKYSNGQWHTKQMIHLSLGLNSTWPRIDVDGNRIYIIWCQNYPDTGGDPDLDILLMEKLDGGSWPTEPTNISRLPTSVSVHPFFKVRNGNIHAAWMDDHHEPANWNIYYAERIGGSLSPSVHLAPSWNQYAPALTVDDAGVVHLIYTNKGNPAWYMRKTASGWSSPREISSGPTSVTTLDFMKFAQGYNHAAWRQVDGGGDYIFYARGAPDGRWEAPVKVPGSGQGEYPGLDVDSRGRVHVVYSDWGVGGERDIFYVRLDQIGNMPVASFTAEPLKGAPPLTVNFDASASYDPNGTITSYRWEFGDGGTASGVKVSYTYQKRGKYAAKLTVTDNENNSGTATKEISVGLPPVAQFTANPKIGRSPLTVNFDASASYDPDGTISSYSWDFGDGTSGTGKTVSHTYTKIAVRTATLTVKDDDGIEASSSQQIEITAAPVAEFTHNPKEGDAPLKVEFDASASAPSAGAGRITSYEWDYGDGSGPAFGQKVSYTYTKYGRFTVTMEVTDDKGLKASSRGTVYVFAKPKASFSSSTTEGVVPIDITFDAFGSIDKDGRIVSYRWTIANLATLEGRIVTYNFKTPGEYKITLTVTDNDGYTDTASSSVRVYYKTYPPLNVKVVEIVNEGLFISDYINKITWSKNPENDGKNVIVKYRIYRKKKTEDDNKFIVLKEVGPGTFEYYDKGLKTEANMKSYAYALTAWNDKNIESEIARPSGMTPSAQENQKTNLQQNPARPKGLR